MFPSRLSTETLEFVVKVTKHCNLRCRYCYEFPFLADKARISQETLERMFENVCNYVRKYGQKRLTFCWHGGEPFMLPLDYWIAVSEISKRVFGSISDNCEVVHIVQTNLTILSDKHIAFLKSGSLFDHIGISFDGFGSQRLFASGQDSTELVASNLQILLDAEITVGAISVVTAQSLPWMAGMYQFFDTLGIEWRILPFYMSATSEQVQEHSISSAQLVQLYKEVFEQWLRSETATPVYPIEEYIEYAVRTLARNKRAMFDAAIDECVFIVGTDGQLWSTAEAYDSGCSYGNIFRDPLEQILSSAAREGRCRRSAARIDQYCRNCVYYEYCPGDYVGEATWQQVEELAKEGCPVAPLLDYILERLRHTQVGQQILADTINSH